MIELGRENLRPWTPWTSMGMIWNDAIYAICFVFCQGCSLNWAGCLEFLTPYAVLCSGPVVPWSLICAKVAAHYTPNYGDETVTGLGVWSCPFGLSHGDID